MSGCEGRMIMCCSLECFYILIKSFGLLVNTEDSSNSDECTLHDIILLLFPDGTGNDWNQLFEAPNLASKPSCTSLRSSLYFKEFI